MKSEEDTNKILNDKAIANKKCIQKVVDEHALRQGDVIVYMIKKQGLDVELLEGTIRNIRNDHIVVVGDSVHYIICKELEERSVKVLTNRTAVIENYRI